MRFRDIAESTHDVEYTREEAEEFFRSRAWLAMMQMYSRDLDAAYKTLIFDSHTPERVQALRGEIRAMEGFVALQQKILETALSGHERPSEAARKDEIVLRERLVNLTQGEENV